MELSFYLTAISVLLLGLWPWFGPWRTGADVPAAGDAEAQNSAALSKPLPSGGGLAKAPWSLALARQSSPPGAPTRLLSL